MYWLQWLIFLVSAPLQIFVIISLRRRFKDYPLVFFFSAVLLLTTAVDAVLFSGSLDVPKYWVRTYYYRNETVRQFLLFTVVLSLIERATQGSAHRFRILAILGLTSVSAVLLSLYIHADVRPFALLMTVITRDLSFGSAVLTLLLWVMLISGRVRDRELLMVTVGLGLEFTGEAIGQSLRQLAAFHHDRSIMLTGNLFLSLSHLMRLYVWMQAFRQSGSREKVEEPDEKQREVFPRPAQTLFEGAVS